MRLMKDLQQFLAVSMAVVVVSYESPWYGCAVESLFWAVSREPAAPGLDGGRAGIRDGVGMGAVAAAGLV